MKTYLGSVFIIAGIAILGAGFTYHLQNWPSESEKLAEASSGEVAKEASGVLAKTFILGVLGGSAIISGGILLES